MSKSMDEIGTVAELIEALRECPQDARVTVIMSGTIGAGLSLNVEEGTDGKPVCYVETNTPEKACQGCQAKKAGRCGGRLPDGRCQWSNNG